MKRSFVLSILLVGSILTLLLVNVNSTTTGYFSDDFAASSIPTFQQRWAMLGNGSANVLVNKPTSDLTLNNGLVQSKAAFYQGILQMDVNASSNSAFFGFGAFFSTNCLGFQTVGGLVNFVSGNSTSGSCATITSIGSIGPTFHVYTIRWFYNNTQAGTVQYVQACVDLSCFPQFYSTSIFLPPSSIPILIDSSNTVAVDWVSYDPNGVFTSATTSVLTSITSTSTSTTSTSTITTPITTTTGTYHSNTTTSVNTLTSASTTLTTATSTTSTISSTTTSVTTSVSVTTSQSSMSMTMLVTATSTSTQSVTEAPWNQIIVVFVAVAAVAVVGVILGTRLVRGSKPPQPVIESYENKNWDNRDLPGGATVTVTKDETQQ